MGYKLDCLRIKVLLFLIASIPVLGPTQPPIQWASGALSLGIKQLGCETDHSPPADAEVKNTWIYKSFCLHGIMLT
jgi:hypothetical protein